MRLRDVFHSWPPSRHGGSYGGFETLSSAIPETAILHEITVRKNYPSIIVFTTDQGEGTSSLKPDYSSDAFRRQLINKLRECVGKSLGEIGALEIA